MNSHSCIKCKKAYRDDEVDAYYCMTCIEEKKRIAAEIDAKLASLPKERPMSALQEYDAGPKVHGFLHVRF